MWNDDANVINVVSVCKLFEKIDIRDNKWISYTPYLRSFNRLFGMELKYNEKNTYRDYDSRLLI